MLLPFIDHDRVKENGEGDQRRDQQDEETHERREILLRLSVVENVREL